MLNEPFGESAGEGEGEEAEGQGSSQTNYIQVTPQEKEAIERVGILITNPGTAKMVYWYISSSNTLALSRGVYGMVY